MRVAKWGNSLAVRLPAAVVEALTLKEGDDIEIHVAGARTFEVAKAPAGARVADATAKIPWAASPLTSSSTASKPMSAAEQFFDTNVLSIFALGATPPGRIAQNTS